MIGPVLTSDEKSIKCRVIVPLGRIRDYLHLKYATKIPSFITNTNRLWFMSIKDTLSVYTEELDQTVALYTLNLQRFIEVSRERNH